jgi:radical SAM superfamily enzyme YgiQ (UPF0313 family)
MKIYFIWVGWEKLYKLNYNIPPLGILRVAGETPPAIPISFTDETVSPIDFNSDADIVALSFLTPAAGRAYDIAKRFRQLGKHIVFGGTHATIMPEQCSEFADTVFVGEAEGLWARFLTDFSQGTPRKIYRHERFPRLDHLAPVPRHLLKKNIYPYENPFPVGIESVELSRGCTSRCAYCTVPITQGPRFRNRPLPDIVAEFESTAHSGGIIFFTDNNLLGNKAFTRLALEALIPFEKDWIGLLAPEETAADPELLDLMVRSGLCGVYGTVKAITGRETRHAMEIRRDSLKRLLDLGIVVIATFALGWDDHDESVFDRTLKFCRQSGLQVPEFIVNTPFPGSRLFKKYAAESRILTQDWGKYNGNYAVFQPAQMTPAQLESGYHHCYDQFYREVDRDKALFEGFRSRVMKAFIRAGRSTTNRNSLRRPRA